MSISCFRNLFLAFAVALSACGGSGGSSSDTLIEGTLTEAGGAQHRSILFKHGAGQRIGSVEICALGECSITDDEGQWGFLAPEGFDGGEVLFSIRGHGIDTSSIFTIPSGARDIFLDLQHVEGGVVAAHSITADGATVGGDAAKHDHDGHDH